MTADALNAPENPGAAVPTLGTAENQPWTALRRPEGHLEPSSEPDSDLEAAIRKARAAQAAVTRLQRSHATGFRVGQRVTTDTPRSPRFHQRTGVVITTNLGEVGVAFPGAERKGDPNRVDAWFLPSELERVR